MEIAFIIFIGFAILFAYLSVKIIPQSYEFVITRLGAYHKTMGAGVGFIIPLIDRVHARVSIADQVLNDINLEVVSKDNVVFGIELIVVYRVTDPSSAVFRVNSIDSLVIGLMKSLVRSEIGKVELDALQQDRETLNKAIRIALSEAGRDYGVVISRSEITDVRLEASTQKAMAEVLIAERFRRATITRAEGDKRAQELRADADLYETQKQAEGIRVTAEAQASATQTIGEAIKEHGTDAAKFQIAKFQVDAVTELAQSKNSKLIMLPGDVSDGFTRAAAILADAPFVNPDQPPVSKTNTGNARKSTSVPASK